MSKRHTVLKGSTVLIMALATGCAAPGSTTMSPANDIGPKAGAGLISNNAGGLISNNAGGLISNNAGGLISNNAGGLISNNAGGLISNNAGGLISNNAGGLTGTVSGPAAGLISNNAGGLISNNAGGLISNNAGGLISNNAGGLISNNAGGLISNNAGGYFVLQAEGDAEVDADMAKFLQTVPNAKVAVFNERGEQISYAWATTDDNGQYTFTRLKPSGPIVFIKAVYTIEGRQVVLITCAPAPRLAGLLNVAITPASTIVAKKLGEMLRLRAVNVATVNATSIDRLSTELAPTLTARGIVAAAIFQDDTAAEVFDNMLAESPELRTSIVALAARSGVANVVSVTPEVALAEAPAAGPGNGIGNADGSGTGVPAGAQAGGSAGGVAIAPGPSGGADGSAGAAPGPDGGTTPATGPGNTTGAQTGTQTGASGPTGGTSTGGGTAPVAGSAGNTAPDPIVEALKASVGTLATAKALVRLASAPGSNEFVIATDTSIQTGSASSLSGAVTLSEDTSTAAHAVTYDGSTRYTLSGNVISGGGKTATIQGVSTTEPGDFVVKDGFAYVTCTSNNTIVKTDLSSGATTLLAGTKSGIGTFADGTGADAKFNGPSGITFSGNDLYVADQFNRRIRKVTLTGEVSTFVGGNLGKTDGAGAEAAFQQPTDITIDDKGNFYVTDQNSHTIRKITSLGMVTTIAGNTSKPGATKDGVGKDGTLYFPTSLTWGKIGTTDVLFVGQYHGIIRVVSGY